VASKRKRQTEDVYPLPEPLRLAWHKGQWERLHSDISRLPHALLLQGQAGLGKQGFAVRLAHSLLCGAINQTEACGTCKNCLLLAAGTHPDLNYLRPSEPGKAIVVDQVRELADFLYKKPHLAKMKVIVIDPADAMNTHAANSLLKMLEEPPLGNLLLLVSSRPESLPVTIRSRCLAINFSIPPANEALTWLHHEGLDVATAEQALSYAHGAPLTAKQLVAGKFLDQPVELLRDIAILAAGHRLDITAVAAKWKKAGSSQSLQWLQGFAQDMIRRQSGVEPDIRPTDGKAEQWLQDMAKRLNLNELFRFLDSVSEAGRLTDSVLDEQLLIEGVLTQWKDLATGRH